MLRKLTFWLLRRYTDKSIVFVNVEEGYIIDWEIEDLQIKVENNADSGQNNDLFVKTCATIKANVKGLSINTGCIIH